MLLSFMCTLFQLPVLQDDGPPTDNYGRFSNWDRGSRGGSRERGHRGSRNWGGRDYDSDDGFRRGGRSNRTDNSWSMSSRRSDDDWLISGRRSGRSSSFGSRDRLTAPNL